MARQRRIPSGRKPRKPERCKSKSTLQHYITAMHPTLQNDGLYWSNDGEIRCSICGPNSKPIPNCSKLPQHVRTKRHKLRKQRYRNWLEAHRKNKTTIGPPPPTALGVVIAEFETTRI